jgi:IclR family transcriptional regulator, acetate operon repressor
MTTIDPGKTITTVDRATDVLTLFTTTPQATLGVTEISQALRLSKAVVHRILTTLVAKGYVQVDEQRRYALGPAVLALGLTYLDRIDLRRLARGVMETLSETTHETSTLSIRSGWTRVYVDQVTPSREVKMSVPLGQPFPLHAGSSSKAFLAFLPETEREDYLKNGSLAALTDSTITNVKALRAELERIRELGYARSMGERQAGAASIAAPVLDHVGQPVASISLCGPIERFGPATDAAVPRLLAATADLSRQLGWVAP